MIEYNTFNHNGVSGGSGEHRIPNQRHLHLRVGFRQPGELELQEPAVPHRAQRLHEQLGRRHPLGELQPVLRVPGQQQAPATARWSTRRSTLKYLLDAVPGQDAALLQRLPLEDAERAGRGQRVHVHARPPSGSRVRSRTSAGTTAFSPSTAATRRGARTRPTSSPPNIAFHQNNKFSDNTYAGRGASWAGSSARRWASASGQAPPTSATRSSARTRTASTPGRAGPAPSADSGSASIRAAVVCQIGVPARAGRGPFHYPRYGNAR